jgi:signal peptidase I
MFPEDENPAPSRLDPQGETHEMPAITAAPAPGSPAEPLKPNPLNLWLRDIAVAVGASVLIVLFLYQPVKVEGTSMLPRLEDRDRLFINKFVYRFESIQRGDVVVFHYPRDPAKSYIKRVIALPGDRLRIERGEVYLNGRHLPELYVPDEFRDMKSMPETIIPEEAYFMMGDHRSISSDSREFGPVDRDLIYGKAVFIYWPTKDAGVVN